MQTNKPTDYTCKPCGCFGHRKERTHSGNTIRSRNISSRFIIIRSRNISSRFFFIIISQWSNTSRWKWRCWSCLGLRLRRSRFGLRFGFRFGFSCCPDTHHLQELSSAQCLCLLHEALFLPALIADCQNVRLLLGLEVLLLLEELGEPGTIRIACCSDCCQGCCCHLDSLPCSRCCHCPHGCWCCCHGAEEEKVERLEGQTGGGAKKPGLEKASAQNQSKVVALSGKNKRKKHP